jgi:hypothetical protein
VSATGRTASALAARVAAATVAPGSALVAGSATK